MTSGCKAAIFDMDGTLLNSMRFWRLVGLEYLVAHDLPVPEWPASRLFGTSGRATVTHVLEENGVPYDDAALVDELERRMAAFEPKTKELSGYLARYARLVGSGASGATLG